MLLLMMPAVPRAMCLANSPGRIIITRHCVTHSKSFTKRDILLVSLLEINSCSVIKLDVVHVKHKPSAAVNHMICVRFIASNRHLKIKKKTYTYHTYIFLQKQINIILQTLASAQILLYVVSVRWCSWHIQKLFLL